jgi:hypothetical protein
MSTATGIVEHDVNTDIDALQPLQSPDLGSVDQLARDDDTREDVVAKDRNQCVLACRTRQEIGIIGWRRQRSLQAKVSLPDPRVAETCVNDQSVQSTQVTVVATRSAILCVTQQDTVDDVDDAVRNIVVGIYDPCPLTAMGGRDTEVFRSMQ